MKHLPLGNDPTVHVSELCLGTMYFGTRIDEPTSFAILDRFVDAGGTFIDTANCYCFWTDGGQGGESERLIGRWLRSRGLRDKVVLASKVGAQIVDPSRPYSARNREGLAASTIKAQAAQSLKQLGVDRLDVYYTHVDDRATTLEQTLRGLAELVSNGDVAVVGASNYPTWRLALVRDIARRSGLPLFRAVQMRHSYLEARHLRVPAPEATQFPITPSCSTMRAPMATSPCWVTRRCCPVPMRGPTGRCRRTTTHPGPTAGWVSCMQWPGSSGPRRTRWCSPGCSVVPCR